MKTKYVHEHPKWKLLAKKSDDLRYVLITYGNQFSKKTLKTIQEEAKAADRAFTRFENCLFKQGYWALA